jgi:hypothetical protein
MTQFNKGQRVRINEGELEGIEGFVVEWGEHVTSVDLRLLSGAGVFPVYTELLEDAAEPHESWTHIHGLYGDVLKNENYVYRLTTYVGGLRYTSQPMNSPMLKQALKHAPAGLEVVECRLGRNDTPQGISWKLMWSA